MTAQQKIGIHRLSLLRLAEALGNVLETCWRRDVYRSQFYEYKRAFQEQGFQGLLDRPPILKSFPNETPKEVKERIIALSIEHPAQGQQRVSYAFGKLYTSKRPETAVDVPYDRVLPFYQEQELSVEHILTDNGRQYCGRAMIHPYQVFLELSEIKHRTTKVSTPRTNGFVERFNRTVLDEFFRETFRKKLYTAVDDLQHDLDAWLNHYNHERPHRGYRNMGKRPIETI